MRCLFNDLVETTPLASTNFERLVRGIFTPVILVNGTASQRRNGRAAKNARGVKRMVRNKTNRMWRHDRPRCILYECRLADSACYDQKEHDAWRVPILYPGK